MSDTINSVGDKLTVRVPEALLVRADRGAHYRGVGRSEFARQALAAQTEVVLGSAGDHQPPSAYDVLAAGGVIGAFAGPRGLSTTTRASLRERIRAAQ